MRRKDIRKEERHLPPEVQDSLVRGKKLRRALGRPMLYDLWAYVLGMPKDALFDLKQSLAVYTYDEALPAETRMALTKLWNLVGAMYRAEGILEDADAMDPKIREAFKVVLDEYREGIDYLARKSDEYPFAMRKQRGEEQDDGGTQDSPGAGAVEEGVAE